MAILNLATRTLHINQLEIPQYRRRPEIKFQLEGASPEVEYNWLSRFSRGILPTRVLTVREMEALRRNMPIIHACIEFLKARMMAFSFKILKEGKKHNNLSQKRADRVRSTLQGPNQYGHTFRQNFVMWLDNLLHYDIGAIEKAIGLMAIDQIGTLDVRFLRPNVQDVSGTLNFDQAYLECHIQDFDRIINTYRADEVLWGNLNPMPKSFYGFSPLEVLHNIITMSIMADKHNIKIVHPNSEKGGGVFWLGDVDATVRRDFESRYDEIRKSDPGRPVFTGGGNTEPKYISLNESQRFDWEKIQYRIAEICTSCWGITLQDIGIRSEHGSAGVSAVEDLITLRSAIIPRMLIVQDLLNTGLIKPIGGDDLYIEFETKKDEPLETRTRAASMALGRGIMTLNEARELVDETLEEYAPEIGDEPFIVAGNVALKLRDIMSGKLEKDKLAAQQMQIDAKQKADTQNSQNQNVVNAQDKFTRASGKQAATGNNQNWQG